MKIFGKKIWKNAFTTLGVAILTLFIVYGGYKIFAQVEYAGQLFFTKNDYHLGMNSYFNDKIERLVELMEEEDFFNHVDFVAPEDEENCTDTNVSTYCVAVGALDIYIDYLNELNALKGFLPGTAEEIQTQEEAVRETGIRKDEIAKEAEEAKLVFEATISAYDQFRLAYPTHIKYETIINNLIKYKLALKRLRNRIERFPSKFIDASSSECK
ncbi:hypothetical protein GF366_00210 [Candidatus Peregrinibacteria bacterium]|nr:hypothetical protein [Candidatus Peregrinibacteria bacterium]